VTQVDNDVEAPTAPTVNQQAQKRSKPPLNPELHPSGLRPRHRLWMLHGGRCLMPKARLIRLQQVWKTKADDAIKALTPPVDASDRSATASGTSQNVRNADAAVSQASQKLAAAVTALDGVNTH
jgi:hypothetical protein